MRGIILTVCLSLICAVSNSQLIIKNNFQKPYKVAVAFYDTGFTFSGWVSKGWLEVPAGEEKEMFYTNPREKYIYYIAIADNDTISGNKKILVDPEKDFIVKHAILNITKEDNSNLEWFLFREVRRGFTTKMKKKLIITLGD